VTPFSAGRGETVGVRVGYGDGARAGFVGSGGGSSEGETLGDCVGFLYGILVGDFVGFIDGILVGDFVVGVIRCGSCRWHSWGLKKS